MQTYLAIEIGGTKLQLVAGNGDGVIFHRWRFEVDRSAGGAGIRARIQQALPEIVRAFDIAAVGVGYGGPVDWQSGQICCSHQIEGWADFPLGQWLHDLTGRPVAVDNDANVAALGEALRGAGQGNNPVFYVTLGSGVGGGMVVNGAIYHGAKPGESEIGHVRLNKAGTIVEERCSGWAVDHRVRAAITSGTAPFLARLAAGRQGGEARHLSAAVAAGEEVAATILRETADDLSFGLSHVVHLMHPQVIVLGGGLSLLGEPLQRAVQESLPHYVMHALAPGPRILLAALKEDAVPVGALLLASALRRRE